MTVYHGERDKIKQQARVQVAGLSHLGRATKLPGQAGGAEKWGRHLGSKVNVMHEANDKRADERMRSFTLRGFPRTEHRVDDRYCRLVAEIKEVLRNPDCPEPHGFTEQGNI